MIGVDTNVLVRYLTQDDARQARVVEAFVAAAAEDAARLHVDDIVICELVWVLRSAYRMSKATIVSALDEIVSTASFSFENREVLRLAVADYREGAGDFSDYLIGRRNARAGASPTATLDRSLEDSPLFSLLT